MSTSSGKKKEWFTNKKGLRSTVIAAIIFSIIAIILIIILYVLVSSGWGKKKASPPQPPPPPPPPAPTNYYWILTGARHVANGENAIWVSMRDVLPDSCFPNGDNVGTATCCLDYAASQNALWCSTPELEHNPTPTFFRYGTGPLETLDVNLDWNSWILAPILPITANMNLRTLQDQDQDLPQKESIDHHQEIEKNSETN